MSDKYIYNSLKELLVKRLEKALNVGAMGEWREAAALVYDYTMAKIPAHEALRALVINATDGRRHSDRFSLRDIETEELLRAQAELATGLLLQERINDKHKLWICETRIFTHIGKAECRFIKPERSESVICPRCGREDDGEYEDLFVQRDLANCTACTSQHTTWEQD